MKIEVSPKEYWKELKYDAVLYCALLNIDGKNDWRLRQLGEDLNIGVVPTVMGLWYETTDYYFGFETVINLAIPVRDNLA
jgi:hypothetical protein